MNEKILFSHPGCPPFAQQAARALFEAELLSGYVTTFAYNPSDRLGRVVKQGMRLLYDDPENQLSRRKITEVPERLVRTHPFPELIRTLASKSPFGEITANMVWEKAERWFDKTVAGQLNGERAIYGYEHAAKETFKSQKRRGGLCIYDMPICHHAKSAALLKQEAEQYPETQTPIDARLKRVAPRVNARKDEELRLADLVITPSVFVKESLLEQGVADSNVRVIPFGAPPVATVEAKQKRRSTIFLSAGSQSVRKGTHYLLEAWRKLNPGANVELWLIGKMSLPSGLLNNLPGKVVISPSVPRHELFRIYQQASMLMLPSLCEGFALVITEAMANGLPVITTANSGALGFLTHGKDGFIVPTGESDCLAETMQWAIDNPEGVAEMSANALLRVANWQWSDYRAQLANEVSSFLAQRAA
ncbi:MAG TPA: glycosyltransferase family 4 protein [Pyrinomonadaceae bacterium]